MKKKSIVEFEVGEMEFGGVSRSIYDGKRVKMKGGISGQKVRAAVKRKRSDSLEVKLLEVIEKSPLEVSDVCDHYDGCGGCSMLSVPYNKQLEIKMNQVKKLFDDAGLDGYEFCGIESSPSNTVYRNKMEYTFGDEYKDGPLSLGMHKTGRFIDIVTVDKCRLVDSDFNSILVSTRDFFDAKGIPYYRSFSAEGFLRHLVLRKGENTGEIMVNIVTTSQMDYDMSEYVDLLLSLNLDNRIVSVLHTINDRLSDAVICDELRVLYGNPYYHEEVLGLRFKVSPFSFFQTNTRGAERLYSIARDFAGDTGDGKVVFDLYSGTGTIGQIMAQKASKVYGIELVEEAVVSANDNARSNGLLNCEFIAGDVSKVVRDLKQDPDLIIVDPPRAGIQGNGVKDIADFGAKEIVYVSCNPKSLVDNIIEFEERGYRLIKLKLMDMFPNTPHVETVALLSKLDVDKHIDVEIKLDELDLTSAESKATYAKNKEYILEFRSDNISELYENSVEALPIDIEKYLKEIINFIQENNSSYLDTLRDFKSDILSSEEFFKIQYGSIVSEDVELFLKIYKSKYISYRHALIILRSLVELIIEFKYLIQNPSYREKFIGDTEFKQSDKFSVNDFKQLGSKRFKNGKISIAKMAVDIGEKKDSDEKLSLYSIYIILSEQVHNLALHYIMNTIEMLEEGEQIENFVEDNKIFIIFILDSFMKTYMSETSDI